MSILKGSTMSERYFKTANEIMNFSDQCADEEAINILKDGYLKIFELAERQGSIIKRASTKPESDSE